MFGINPAILIGLSAIFAVPGLIVFAFILLEKFTKPNFEWTEEMDEELEASLELRDARLRG
ncbi:hypothetical protein [Erythrobacter aureus]|uniref:Uncharacterized protein n=1 Tax=Erythrobacter aureus TaxID=2182384 RepID=A0A345YIU2_9SPHN|nr:hypothetical protein [Erythrobacter aureus]AXK43844.1 hypothetical protein DVR09_15430 [Erythrobacter aureus]